MFEINPYVAGLLTAYAAFLLSIVSPGPNFLAILGTSMGAGRKAGMALALGVSLGSVCWATLTVLGISAILTKIAGFLIFVKIVGGCYLLFLAFKAFRQAARRQDMEAKKVDAGEKTPFGYFRQGLLVQMTNPKALLAWIAITSLGLQTNAPAWVSVALVVGTGTLGVVVHLFYALAFSSTPALNTYKRARRGIQATLGLFFTLAGLKLLSSRLS
ncbi:MAG: LysE family translocator [Hyphomicrobiales bacterium]